MGSGLSGISRTNGEPSLGLNVIKETDANTVEVAEEVERVLDDVRDRIGRIRSWSWPTRRPTSRSR